MNIGVDVFSGNGSPQWPAAASTGQMRFAIARASEGTTPDTMFATYWKALAARGTQRGAYALLRFGAGVASPVDQMQVFLSAIAAAGPSLPSDLPPTIDLEFPSGRAATGLSAAEALEEFLLAHRFLRQALGYAPMTYTSYVVWTDPASLDNLPAPELADTPLWVKYWPFAVETLAEYDAPVIDAMRPPPCPPPWGTSYAIQQYQGDAIQYPGFVTTVDLNNFHVIAQGSVNGFVAWVQRRVGVTPDGIFGPATATAVKAFQYSCGLGADGVVGPQTFARLARVAVPATP